MMDPLNNASVDPSLNVLNGGLAKQGINWPINIICCSISSALILFIINTI